ncbi:ER membrane protein SH3 [Cokeromyces recurvatus]|uniref:ER membrane protein SH3 n=1 Tax=Cokeromyces recurvatus TaxID=90255 RepID=UPI002220CCD2|nr:ER membrane protein SH3 [Cokeromyces recurvatus]KAI7901237.1 ER membrane protein SH3 [Cokeromyces recurvatus]
MDKEYLQTVKVVLILCSCFFSYGIYWADWAFDYYLLWSNSTQQAEAISRATFYYANQAQIPNILQYVPIINLFIAAVGFATGLLTVTDGSLLFDGASLVLMFFGLFTYLTTVKPAIQTIVESTNMNKITASLKNIAAAHFIIVLAITGIIGLQITHYFVLKKPSKEEAEADMDEEIEEDEEKEYEKKTE